MIDKVLEELTKLLIKQDLKDKQEGIEIIQLPKINIIKQNIRLLKTIKSLKK